jgi:prevent-host-death family protein
VHNKYELYILQMASSKRVSASEARAHFADVLDRVSQGGERVVIERRGKVLGAVVSRRDLEVLERVRELEDEEDRAAVARTRKERGSIAWTLIKRDLELK